MLKFLSQLFTPTKKDIRKQKILIFCGAGLSAESGLSTFRDSNGLWNNHNVLEVCNLKTFEKNKKMVFEFYNARKLEIIDAIPNIAHKTIANIQSKYGIENVHIFTSNIDDLLEKAGCKNVVHVHGDCNHMQCLECEHIWNIGSAPYDNNGICPECESHNIKPNIIFFNEEAPKYKQLTQAFESSGEIIHDAIVPNIKLFVGTSFKVLPTYIFYPKRGKSILVDLHPTKQMLECFEQTISKPATEGVTEAAEIIHKWYV